MSLAGFPPLLGFLGKLFMLLPAVWQRAVVLSILSVRVVVASAGYFAVAIGALFVALGSGS